MALPDISLQSVGFIHKEDNNVSYIVSEYQDESLNPIKVWDIFSSAGGVPLELGTLPDPALTYLNVVVKITNTNELWYCDSPNNATNDNQCYWLQIYDTDFNYDLNASTSTQVDVGDRRLILKNPSKNAWTINAIVDINSSLTAEDDDYWGDADFSSFPLLDYGETIGVGTFLQLDESVLASNFNSDNTKDLFTVIGIENSSFPLLLESNYSNIDESVLASDFNSDVEINYYSNIMNYYNSFPLQQNWTNESNQDGMGFSVYSPPEEQGNNTSTNNFINTIKGDSFSLTT
mgnify:CR=1 FL=1